MDAFREELMLMLAVGFTRDIVRCVAVGRHGSAVADSIGRFGLSILHEEFHGGERAYGRRAGQGAFGCMQARDLLLDPT